MALLGIPFECCAVDADEIASGGAEHIARENAMLKARAAAADYADAVIIGADTVVAIDGAVLGKPRDDDDAFRMLRMLQGRRHEVYTGVCLIDTPSGREESAVEMTEVFFSEMSDGEIMDYVRSGEPRDKAGAYGIQGRGGIYIRGVKGCYNNVVGLPVSLLYGMLRGFGFFGSKGE